MKATAYRVKLVKKTEIPSHHLIIIYINRALEVYDESRALEVYDKDLGLAPSPI